MDIHKPTYCPITLAGSYLGVDISLYEGRFFFEKSHINEALRGREYANTFAEAQAAIKKFVNKGKRKATPVEVIVFDNVGYGYTVCKATSFDAYGYVRLGANAGVSTSWVYLKPAQEHLDALDQAYAELSKARENYNRIVRVTKDSTRTITESDVYPDKAETVNA